MLLNFEKIFLTFSCSYLIGVSFWLISQDKLEIPLFSASIESSEPSLTPDQAQFIVYMRRALQMIEQKPSNNSVASLSNQPTVYIDKKNNLPLATPTPSQLREKLYIEVNPPEKFPLGSSSTSSNLVNSLLPSFGQVETKSSLSTPEPHFNYTLVGLLESGEESVALFDLNGMTKKIAIGDTIGESGQILISIGNQQAIVNYQGQIKFISVGQQL